MKSKTGETAAHARAHHTAGVRVHSRVLTSFLHLDPRRLLVIELEDAWLPSISGRATARAAPLRPPIQLSDLARRVLLGRGPHRYCLSRPARQEGRDRYITARTRSGQGEGVRWGRGRGGTGAQWQRRYSCSEFKKGSQGMSRGREQSRERLVSLRRRLAVHWYCPVLGC